MLNCCSKKVLSRHEIGTLVRKHYSQLVVWLPKILKYALVPSRPLQCIVHRFGAVQICVNGL